MTKLVLHEYTYHLLKKDANNGKKRGDNQAYSSRYCRYWDDETTLRNKSYDDAW